MRSPAKLLSQNRFRVVSKFAPGAAICNRSVCIGFHRHLYQLYPRMLSPTNILIKEAKAKTILEIGTSHGYSTVWLAEAARATGGKVLTLDLHAGKQEYARNALCKAGLADLVEFKLGDARESISTLSGPIDFVLLDLWKDLYIPCFDLFYPLLSRGAIVVADNMLFPEFSRADAELYRQHVRAKADLQSMLLPVGSRIEVSRCLRDLEFK